MIAYSKDQKKLVVPASLGNFASDAPVSGGVTPEEVQAMIDSSLTSYDETVQGYIADTNVDVEENTENISTLSGLTSGISSDVEALSAVTAQNAQDIQDLSAYTATIQSGEMNDEAIILYTANANIDALYEEIAAAYNAGKTVFLRGLNTDNEITILRLIADYTDSFSFTGTSVKGSDTSGIKTYAVSIWKYGDNPAGMNGVQNGKFVPETIISNYELLPASASWLGGVKVGSGLTIDGNGVLSVSGGTGGDSKYVVVEALSAITNPVEGMIAYVPAYSVDNTYQFTKYQRNGGAGEGYLGWIRRQDTNELCSIYQSGNNFFWNPWEQGNGDFIFRTTEWTDQYDGSTKYEWVWRSYNDAEDENQSWIEIANVGENPVLFDVDISNANTSLTSETVTTYYSEAFYQYENGAWKEMYLPEIFDFDEATEAQRVALFNAIKGNQMGGDWNVKMAFYAKFTTESRVRARTKLQFCDIYGNEWLFFSATFGHLDYGEGTVSAIIRLYSDGHFDKEVWAADVRNPQGSEISRDGRLQYDMALSAFTVNGSPDYNVTGNTCTWDGPYDWSDIDQVLSTGNGKFPSFRFDMYPGNGDSDPVLSMAFPILSISSFSPAVTCTDVRDGTQLDFNREIEYNYGKYSIKLWASTDNNYRYANIRLVEN